MSTDNLKVKDMKIHNFAGPGIHSNEYMIALDKAKLHNSTRKSNNDIIINDINSIQPKLLEDIVLCTNLLNNINDICNRICEYHIIDKDFIKKEIDPIFSKYSSKICEVYGLFEHYKSTISKHIYSNN